jgi:hypothetical protein
MRVPLRKLGVFAGTTASAFAISGSASTRIIIQYSGRQVAGRAKGGLPTIAAGAASVATVVGNGSVNVLVSCQDE